MTIVQSVIPTERSSPICAYSPPIGEQLITEAIVRLGSIFTEQKRQTLDADAKLGPIPILALASASL